MLTLWLGSPVKHDVIDFERDHCSSSIFPTATDSIPLSSSFTSIPADANAISIDDVISGDGDTTAATAPAAAVDGNEIDIDDI